MRLPKIINQKNKADSFDSLPASERRRIMEKAVRGANKEQHEIVRAYRESRCQAQN